MIGDFINLWYFEHGVILEKIAVRLTNFKGNIISRGIYISNIPVKMHNGQVINHKMYTNDIYRNFSTIDDANDYLKLSFEEFVEKYPKHEGKARFGKVFYINGKRFSNEIS